jgi:hypothetical protein
MSDSTATPTLPRFVVIDGDPAVQGIAMALFGPGVVVDRQSGLGYGFGAAYAAEAAEAFNSGVRSIDEGFIGLPLNDAERGQLAAAEEALS